MKVYVQYVVERDMEIMRLEEIWRVTKDNGEQPSMTMTETPFNGAGQRKRRKNIVFCYQNKRSGASFDVHLCGMWHQ